MGDRSFPIEYNATSNALLHRAVELNAQGVNRSAPMKTLNKHKVPSYRMGRRTFIQQSAFAAAVLGSTSSLFGMTKTEAKPLKAAGYRFPRVEALFDGSVAIEGFDVHFQHAGIGDSNTDLFSGAQTLDFTEIGLHPFMIAYANENFRDYTLLPIFPLRLFRHKSIFIRTGSGIKTPGDLRGRSIGTPGYSSTSLTWIRGILKDEYGVSPEEIDWVLSNKDSSANEAGKVSKQESVVPEGINVRMGTTGLDESELLLNGEVDALFHGATPRAFLEGNPKITRLFKNSRDVELAYYRKTGIFPIMHAVAVRKTLVEEHPEILKAIFDAYSKAKTKAYGYMTKMGWAADMLPWYGQELEHTVAAMGSNFYSYGIKPNRKSLETLFRYSYEQGLAQKNLAIEDLFHQDSLNFEE